MSTNALLVAVSGGVDSMVLLDSLVRSRLHGLAPAASLPAPNTKVIVAHFDHGIREDSAADAEFVGGVAQQYGLEFISERANLGEGVSEEAARNARYNFLRQNCKKYNAQLATAHHQNDVLETMLINLLRGTDWHGLVSLQSDHVYRPLLNTPKKTILEYARQHKLIWKEDSTNGDQTYLRNYVRLTLIPKLLKRDADILTKLLDIQNNTSKLKKDIATELQKIISTYHLPPTTYQASRYDLIMFPFSVAYELIYQILIKLDPSWHPSTAQLKRTLHFIKAAHPHKQLEVSGALKVAVTTDTAEFIAA